jgi:hypothetical protein
VFVPNSQSGSNGGVNTDLFTNRHALNNPHISGNPELVNEIVRDSANHQVDAISDIYYNTLMPGLRNLRRIARTGRESDTLTD